MIPLEYASPDNQYNSLLQLFDSIYPLTEELTCAIVENSDLIEVKKKTKLLWEGDISNSIYFIVKGAARVYYLNSFGTETTTWFLFENELLISVYSFFTAATRRMLAFKPVHLIQRSIGSFGKIHFAFGDGTLISMIGKNMNYPT